LIAEDDGVLVAGEVRALNAAARVETDHSFSEEMRSLELRRDSDPAKQE
jgi:hypothetical protein